MGYWGGGSFENDHALDWVGDLAAARDLTFVRAALEAASGVGEAVLDAPVGAEAVAAAEVVAALRGNAAADMPEEAAAWARRHRRHPEAAGVALQAAALRALQRVADDPSRSELRLVTDEGDPEARDVWHAAVADLRARLSMPTAPPVAPERRWWEVWKRAT